MTASREFPHDWHMPFASFFLIPFSILLCGVWTWWLPFWIMAAGATPWKEHGQKQNSYTILNCLPWDFP